MRILLAHNSTYYPSHGGGDKSNRLLMEALAARGHEARVVTRVERFGDEAHARLAAELEGRGVATLRAEGVSLTYTLGGVDVRVLTRDPNLRSFFSMNLAEFRPEIVVTSTDDPGQLLTDLALKQADSRMVYLVRATIAVPFGPESSMVSRAKTEVLRQADGIVGVSEYVAEYVRKWGGLEAVHLPISLLEHRGPFPVLGSFENPYVTMVNPCAVKGISIFLELADRIPEASFAAIPTWGTTPEELAELEARPNITIVPPVDNIDDLLRLTKILLVPSVWAEARSRLLMEAMSRGVPVIASDIGGIREAHLGVDYLLPVRPVTGYKPVVDANMVPVAEVPPQDVGPWESTLRRLLNDRQHYEELAFESRRAATGYIEDLTVLPFERYLQEVRSRPKKHAPAPRDVAPAPQIELSPEKKKLLALRLKQRVGRAAGNPWFAGLDEHRPDKLLLLCFPYAGGGTLLYRGWRDSLADVATVCAVRLPGRESRIHETPIEDMDDAVDRLVEQIRAIEGRYCFFGHSMGAAMAFEVARKLTPSGLIASAARAPVFRENYQPPPEPSDSELIAELQRLGGMPREVFEKRELLEIALPAIRADARLYRRYRYKTGAALTVPVVVYRGADDPNIVREHADRWAEVTTGGFAVREFPGGHFFFQDSPGFLQALRADVASIGGSLP